MDPRFRGRVDDAGLLTQTRSERARLDRHLRTLAGQDVELVVRPWKAQRSSAQNRRYWALLTVAAESLGWDGPEGLHEEVAHLLLPLPPCPKTGLRRRRRTPKLQTGEFARYTDDVARVLVDFGADLSAWDETAERLAAEMTE
jgi:hypothetical protein